MDFCIGDVEYNWDDFCRNIHRLYTNKHFIEDAQKDYDLKEVEHNPLTEEDKQSILSYLESISDKILDVAFDNPFVIRAYDFLVEERRKHVDSDFDFIPDEFIQNCCKRCEEFRYYQYKLPIYGVLCKDFKEKCRTPGQMPKIVRNLHTPDSWVYENFYDCVKRDGSYSIEKTGLYFE